nr:RNA-directed DNA polymerase, eukaryota, reverse transcriptase zinc-binding domain protein [Tanacetum cinerariifolium]
MTPNKIYLIRVKELDAWFPNFQEDDQDYLSSDRESQEGDVAKKADNNESDVDRLSKSSFMHENSCKKGEVRSHSEDPFNIYGILDEQKNKVCNSYSDEPKFPPGFTPDNNDQEKNVEENIKDTTERLGNKAKRRWIKELCQKHRINFASIKETKAESISLHTIKDLWGNQMFDHVVGSSVVVQEGEGDTVIMGDFNEVRSEHERFGSTFNMQGAIALNNFISSACLIDFPLDEGFNSFMETTWKSLNIVEPNGLIRLKKKLQALKIAIKAWSKEANKRSSSRFGAYCTYEEVKRTVWDCGTNKSLGPDGFSFEFYRKYWTTIDDDVFQAVRDFFVNGQFPRGCNSSFITLIPKIQDAKFVKDFRPISLIGSVYKIIAKNLANKLCVALPYLISDVQSAFVANRQILDRPFILNELLSWCKFKKLNGMIFKVDFENAFDSVKWDYLDETLKAFGFGSKWRNWISSCLNNAMGSVLVNGSPTLEFQFHKGIGVSSNVVAAAASLIGCSILTAPFNYLGVKVGSNMSRITSWDDVISKVSLRLSKWKLKLLLIGVRLSLLKSVLTSIPLYHMSIFKVPIGMLNNLESIRRNFFYEVDGLDRKLAWIGWNMVLTSKKNGGLGVSSFFAHNHALIFKWVWRFLTDGSSLWNHFIKAIFVGNGENTSFWDNSWLGEVALKVLYKRTPRGGVEQENYGLLCSKVANLVLPNISDRWCWSLEGSQEFSVKFSRILIDNTILSKAEVPARWLRVVPSSTDWFLSLLLFNYDRMHLSLRFDHGLIKNENENTRFFGDHEVTTSIVTCLFDVLCEQPLR